MCTSYIWSNDPKGSRRVRLPSFRRLNRRRRPRPAGDRLFRPIGPHVEDEVRALGGRQPVGFFCRGFGLDVNCKRAVGVEFQIFVLRADRIALDFVGREKVMLDCRG